jgi:hypothetical protein
VQIWRRGRSGTVPEGGRDPERGAGGHPEPVLGRQLATEQALSGADVLAQHGRAGQERYFR